MNVFIGLLRLSLFFSNPLLPSLIFTSKPQVRVRVTFSCSIVMSVCECTVLVCVCIQIIKCWHWYLMFFCISQNCIVYMTMAMLHTTNQQSKKERRKPKHFETIPNTAYHSHRQIKTMRQIFSK